MYNFSAAQTALSVSDFNTTSDALRMHLEYLIGWTAPAAQY